MMLRLRSLAVWLLWTFSINIGFANGDVEFHFHSDSNSKVLNDINIEIGHATKFILQANSALSLNTNLTFVYEEEIVNKTKSDKVSVMVSGATVGDSTTTWQLVADATKPGHVALVLGAVDGKTNGYSLSKSFIRFQLFHSQPVDIVSQVIGWIYFAAWSISYYPQVYINWKRKSVVGYNLDYLALNMLGFICYFIYNVSLFWSPVVIGEYKQIHPFDLLPVQINDVVFAIHAVVLTFVIVLQAVIYEKGEQKVTKVCLAILSVCLLSMAILAIIAAVPSVKTFNWLSMVYAYSYVKLGLTVIKYTPQAWQNYKRKSTVGWSIANVLLDMTGGIGSLIQMFLLAYNYNDWPTLLTNPAKFWIGVLGLSYDIIFIIQHYILYRNPISQDYERIAREVE